MKQLKLHRRENRGAAVIGLCLTLVMLLAVIGFFVYDMNRMQQAQRELTALCDSAAMAGSSMLSSQDVSYEDSTENELYSAQTTAAQYAVNMFCTGVILNTQLYDPNATPGGTGIPVSYAINSSVVPVGWQASNSLQTPGAQKISVFVQLVDPSTAYASYQTGNAAGRAFLVQACYGYVPSLNAIGIVSSIPVHAQSTAATQLMNVILVFDCSGSMDDNTRVTFVERTWNQSKDMYNYAIATPAGSSNKLCDYCGLNYTDAPNGTPLNVIPPQHLTDVGYLFNGTYIAWGDSADSKFYKSGGTPLAFDLSMRAYVSVPNPSACYPVSGGGYPMLNPDPLGTRYDNDFGTPPGNCELKYGAISKATNPSLFGNNGAWLTGTFWNGDPDRGWGPGAQSGFQGYYSCSITSGNPDYGHVYFYDPNAMPSPYTGSAYTPFTDMVVNLVNFDFSANSGLNPYINQPLENSSSNYSGFSFTFPTSTFSVFFAEGSAGSQSYYYEGDSQLAGNTYNFSDVSYLVEASRGNLDLDYNGYASNYNNALLASGSNLGTITAPTTPGYQKAYQRLAMYVSQPFATAQAGAFKFFQNLAQTSAAYFGFVGFSASPIKYTGNPDTSTYLYNNGFPTSLFYSCTGTPSATNPTYADFFYHCSVSNPVINPNVWMWSPIIVAPGTATNDPPSPGIAGPSGDGTGVPWNPYYSNPGPLSCGAQWRPKTAVSFGPNAGSNAGNPTSNWAFNNLGFQIPRCFIGTANSDTANGSVQQDSFNGVCSNQAMAVWNPNASPSAGGGAQNWSDGGSNGGTNGLYHCRPLTDTDALEALESALANLGVSVAGNAGAGVSAYSFSTLTGYSASITAQRPGAINVIAFFTDGTPTDTTSINNPGGGSTIDYSSYTSEVIKPAQSSGIPIYSIGLALNSSVQANQYTFLNTLTNNGANGSQFFQVTDPSSLTAAFTSIAKQLTQCVR